MKRPVVLTVICLSFFQVNAQIEITLRKSFIDSHKNTITMETNYFVVKAHPHPNTGAKDGDLHIAGHEKLAGLATVAEIMNAKDQEPAMNEIHAKEGTTTPVHIKGVWRFWCEHPGSEGTFKQGDAAAINDIHNTNPDHVFEFHPLVSVGDNDLLGSLKRIKGFKYKDATTAFNAYSNITCKLKDKQGKIVIQTNGIGYNYVDFWIEVLGSNQFVVADGRFVMCRVVDKEGEVIVNKMRMAFPINSTAEKKVRSLHEGDKMHVAGIPRIDMALIDYRIKHKDDSQFEDILNWNLPVEMIIVSAL